VGRTLIVLPGGFGRKGQRRVTITLAGGSPLDRPGSTPNRAVLPRLCPCVDSVSL
jgi:hypothetical protein